MKVLVSLVTCGEVVRGGRLLSRRGLKVSLDVVSGTRAPVALVRGLLRSLASSAVPRSISGGTGQTLKRVGCIVSYRGGIVTLDTVGRVVRPKFDAARFRLCACLTLVASRYHICTGVRQVRLGIDGDFGCLDYRIGRVTVATTLQYLLGGIVSGAPYSDYVSVEMSRLGSR